MLKILMENLKKGGRGRCVVKVFEISRKFVRIGGKHVEWQWVQCNEVNILNIESTICFLKKLNVTYKTLLRIFFQKILLHYKYFVISSFKTFCNNYSVIFCPINHFKLRRSKQTFQAEGNKFIASFKTIPDCEISLLPNT